MMNEHVCTDSWGMCFFLMETCGCVKAGSGEVAGLGVSSSKRALNSKKEGAVRTEGAVTHTLSLSHLSSAMQNVAFSTGNCPSLKLKKESLLPCYSIISVIV